MNHEFSTNLQRSASFVNANRYSVDEKTVVEALADPRFDFRTIDGIAGTTQLSPQTVKSILQHLGPLVRTAATLSKDRQVLYTIADRPRKMRERFSEAVAFLAGSAL